MRKFGLFLLLATSAMPALAQSSDDGEREARREARAEAGQERVERAPREERMQQREQRQREVQVERTEQPQNDGQRAERVQRYRERVQQQQGQPQQGDGSRAERVQRYREQVQQQQGQQQPRDGSFSERLLRYRDQARQQQVDGQSGRAERLERYRQRQLEAGQQGGGLVQRDRRVRTIPTVQPEAGQVGPVRTDVARDGRRDGRYDRDGRRYDRDNRARWTNNWRNDRRYDWRRYRDRNRSTFSIGFYFDPFGYNYRRFGIGSYLYPNYYQSNYWINDPWQYRLPPAYGPYRWVRYHNDAVLIDTYSGEVADVIYGFFW